MKCPHCGREVQDITRICPYCQKIITTPQGPTTQLASAPPKHSPSHNSQNGTNWLRLFGLLAALVIMGIVISAFGSGSGSSNQVSTVGVHTKADTLFEQGKYQESIAEYSKITIAHPQDNYSWAQIGSAYYNLGNYQNSVDAFQKAVEVAPRDSISWYNLGLSLTYLNRDEDALTAFNNATTLDPKKENAWVMKGYALDTLHRYGEAIGAYDRALNLDPNDELAQKNKEIASRHMK